MADSIATTPPPELSRPVSLDAARRAAPGLIITASAEECAALARRFDLIAIDALSATIDLAVDGDEVAVTGSLHAAVVQRCIATSGPVPQQVGAALHIRCVPLARLEAAEAEAEIELSDADLDVVGYSGGTIDLGELVAESLVLALDLWPRAPDADAFLRARGVVDEDHVTNGAFGALASLRDALAGKGGMD